MSKINFKVFSLLILFAITDVLGQRVAPGVPPQHYQHVPAHQPPNPNMQHPPQPQQVYQQQQQMHLPPGVAPQQYQQQQQQQYQQVPVQNHVPVQQIPVQQVPVQQVPQGHHQQQVPHQAHHAPHGHGHGQQQILHTGNIQEERAHIQEHMQVPIDTSKMSEAELQFHYFKMHDSDNNNKLDGCELIKSLIHWHADDDKKPKDDGADANHKNDENANGHKDGTLYTDEGLAEIIDYVLKTMDINNDGYVDYVEYLTKNDDIGKD